MLIRENLTNKIKFDQNNNFNNLTRQKLTYNLYGAFLLIKRLSKVYFQPLSPQRFLLLTLLTSEGR